MIRADHGWKASYAGRTWKANHIFHLECQLREELADNEDVPTIGFPEVTWAIINVQNVGSVSINGLLIKATGERGKSMDTLLNFESLEDQSTRLYEIRDQLGITNRGMAEAMKVPLPTFERFLDGRTNMKPAYRQLLGLYLLLRESQPDLFKELVPESAQDQRFN